MPSHLATRSRAGRIRKTTTKERIALSAHDVDSDVRDIKQPSWDESSQGILT